MTNDSRVEHEGQPLVTIVVPSLNQGRFIRDAIDSILSQDYPAIELIVMDGASTDETQSAVGEYGTSVRFISEHDRGQADAINKGWRLGRGSILSWLCADDQLLPGAVREVVRRFTEEPDTTLIYGDYEEWDLSRDRLGTCRVGPPDIWTLTYRYLYFAQPTAFVRRSAVESVGFLDETLNWAMDWDLFVRVAWRGSLSYVPRPLARVRLYGETKTRSGGWKRFREIVRVARTHTAQRYPPACSYYAIETLLFGALRAANRSVQSDTRLSYRANEVIMRVGVSALRCTGFWWSRGWYPDGWASKVVERFVWSNGATLRIRGQLPEVLTALHGQELTVEADGIRLARTRLEPGPFTLEAPVPDPHHRWVRVRLQATRSLVPGGRDLLRGPRRLSYLLEELSIGTS